jgi:hypothetical protein
MCLLALVTLLVCGCESIESMRIHRQTSLADQLSLCADVPFGLSAGDQGSVRLRLTNKSADRVQGCIAGGPGEGIQYCRIIPEPFRPFSAEKFHAILNTGMFPAIDHPSCSARFDLAPGESLTWALELLVPTDYSVPEVSLSCTIEVTSGKGCSSAYGCYTASLSSRRMIFAPKEGVINCDLAPNSAATADRKSPLSGR